MSCKFAKVPISVYSMKNCHPTCFQNCGGEKKHANLYKQRLGKMIGKGQLINHHKNGLHPQKESPSYFSLGRIKWIFKYYTK